jgi:hypothetical protein
MPEKVIEKNFEYFKSLIYKDICAQYIELWGGATENTFIRDVFAPMVHSHINGPRPITGDQLASDCITKNSMYRDDMVMIASGYLVEATIAEALGQHNLAWTYLMDAQHNISAATYAGRLRKEMPEIEAEAARDALRSSKSKGGQKTNEVNRVIADKAFELIKARGEKGETWPKVRHAVRDIKDDLWPFMEEKDPERSEANYERSVVGLLKKRGDELSHFINVFGSQSQKT